VAEGLAVGLRCWWRAYARDAAEALREALARLDLEVERAAGGTRSPTYASWAAVAGQLG
jgi:hypothetical protein